ncbi:unnamed protein product [Rotaria sordida]|uniref:G-protein coupled receptors family 1 profile domain-containing protein n=1 Tax=Rotaria sordida TaxID=392033 RepID=A0A815QVL8_9BILA|nr:unnamed protein product [Rotaria sordida]CAF4020341.1 unnamed protein product [Rotaria sordida]
MAAFTILWILHGIPYAVFFVHIQSSTTGKITCTVVNDIFAPYRFYFITPVLTGFLPVSITIVFGLLAYNNVRQLAYRTIPLVRRELDKQLTVMVLVQAVINSFTILPYVIFTILTSNTTIMSNAIVAVQIQFAATITALMYYFNFASPFTIYICVSDRFRRQLIHVLFKICSQCWRRSIVVVNQVTPES